MLFDRIVYADEVNWIAIPELTGPLRVTARTRYHQLEQAATCLLYTSAGGYCQKRVYSIECNKFPYNVQ